jgi:hypothetical protein
MQRTGDEAILLDLASEHYFGLNAVGTRLWELLQQDGDMSAAYRTLLAEYDVTPERLEQDLLALLGQLSDAGLVALD